MNIKSNKTIDIDWNIELCKAEATIENNMIQNVEIKMLNNKENYFQAKDEQFIRDTYKALGELIHLLNKERGVGVDETNLILEEIFGNN